MFDTLQQPPNEDTFRRIKNIVAAFPVRDWTSEEAGAVLAALESIVWGRPFNGGVR